MHCRNLQPSKLIYLYPDKKWEPSGNILPSLYYKTMQALIFVVVSLSGFFVSASQSAGDVTRIHVMLENNIISPYIRPAKNFSRPFTVNISFHLVAIVDFNAASHRLTSSAWLSVTWQDEYLTWESSAYSGITNIFLDPSQLWRPLLTIRNTLKELRPIGQDYDVLVARYDGRVKWFPTEIFETFCHGDVTYFPFDYHTCEWQTFVWAEGEGDFELQPVKSEVDFDSYVGNGEWKVASTAVRRATYHLNDVPLSVVVYEVTLQRRPALVVMTIVLPVFILAGLNVFVFIIPYESGERLSFAVTILLSYGVFMASVVSLLPGSVKTMSILVIAMSVLLILSALYALISALFMRLFDRDDARPVPKTLEVLGRMMERLLHLEIPDPKDARDPPSCESQTGIQKVDKMTWKRLVRSLDVFLFVFFFVLVVLSIVALWAVVLFRKKKILRH